MIVILGTTSITDIITIKKAYKATTTGKNSNVMMLSKQYENSANETVSR